MISRKYSKFYRVSVLAGIAWLAGMSFALHVFSEEGRFSGALRESITFILGEDADPRNLFYQHATEYYHMHPTDRTTYIETAIRSLLGVRDYLAQHPPRNRQPWGVINFVVHSNEWSGLGIPLIPNGKRVTREVLAAAVQRGEFRPLPDDCLDAQTEMRIHGCALGRDQEFLKLLSAAFGGADSDLQRPRVRSSKYFLSYQIAHDAQGRVVQCEQYLTDFWYAFYRKGFRPADILLARQLRQRYPDARVNWREALTRTKPRFPGDSFHYTYILPIKWFVLYADETSRPAVTTPEQQQAWLDAQTELRQYFQELNIPLTAFEWELKTIDYPADNGTLTPAIKAYGKATILCVLQALTEPDPARPEVCRPLHPAWDDPTYYGLALPPAAPHTLLASPLTIQK